MCALISKRAAMITPYTAGEQPRGDVIKLNTNENPYPPSPAVMAAVAAADGLRKYPPTDGGALRQAAARINGVDPSWVFCGNGSDEVLAIAFQALFDGDILMPDVTYSFYPVWAELYGISYRQARVDDGLNIRVADYVNCGGVVLPNPNAPTGIALSVDDLRAIAAANPNVPVIIDEAYYPFGAKTALPLVKERDNVAVVRTLSKSHSLAGLRVGYAIAPPSIISALERIRDSFNSYPCDLLSQAGGAAALEDEEYTRRCAERVIATRERAKAELKRRGFDMPDSKTNFIFVRHEAVPAKEIFAALRERGIYVRYFDKPRIDDRLRITIGTDAQMDALFAALDEIL